MAIDGRDGAGYTVSGVLRCVLGNISDVSCHANSCDASRVPAHGMAGDCADKAVVSEAGRNLV